MKQKAIPMLVIAFVLGLLVHDVIFTLLPIPQTEEKLEVTAEGNDDGHTHDDDHMYGEIDVTDWQQQPSLDIEITEDPNSGINVHLLVENFRFAPEHASMAPIEGEGHAHLYVDGDKVSRIYGHWSHVDNLSKGEHNIMLSLNANNHAELVHGDQSLSVTKKITIE